MDAEQYKQEIIRLRPKAVALAKRYLSDDEEAKDVVQDALLKLWLIRDEVTSPVQALALTIVRNLCIDAIRRQADFSSLPEDISDEDGDDIANHERIERMMAAVNTLPDIQQILLRLRHMDGMSMKDIAELTGCTEANIRKKLSRARMAIRDLYQKRKEI